MPQRLIIADDHPLLRDGLRKVLEELDQVRLTDTASNGVELLDCLRKASADIVLLDLGMPRMDGMETLRILARDFPRVRVIVFTQYQSSKLLREIRLLGAKGYLLKDSPAALVREAVSTVAQGGSWFQEETSASPGLRPGPSGSRSGPTGPPAFAEDDFLKKYQITPREVEVIRRIADGLTSKEISAQLNVSEFTIKAHRRNICRKLNIYTPVGLLNFAKEHGLA